MAIDNSATNVEQITVVFVCYEWVGQGDRVEDAG